VFGLYFRAGESALDVAVKFVDSVRSCVQIACIESLNRSWREALTADSEPIDQWRKKCAERIAEVTVEMSPPQRFLAYDLLRRKIDQEIAGREQRLSNLAQVQQPKPTLSKVPKLHDLKTDLPPRDAAGRGPQCNGQKRSASTNTHERLKILVETGRQLIAERKYLNKSALAEALGCDIRGKSFKIVWKEHEKKYGSKARKPKVVKTHDGIASTSDDLTELDKLIDEQSKDQKSDNAHRNGKRVGSRTKL
jgi:hypothetical protein